MRKFKKNYKKISVKNAVVIIVCVIMACSALLAGLGFMSKGFVNGDVGSWLQRDLNTDNLIKYEDYNDKLADELDNGLKITWRDDGSILLRGNVDDDSINGEQDPVPYAFTNVILEGGKVYTISPDNDKCTKSTFGLMVDYTDANGIVVSEKVDADGFVIDLTEKSDDTVVTISFYYENDVTYYGINSYIRPVLVEGDTAASFYK